MVAPSPGITPALRAHLRQGKPECRALSGNAINANLTSLLLNDRPANVETESQPHSRTRTHFNTLRAVKPLPDTSLLALRETRPLIEYLYPYYIPFCFDSYSNRFILCRIFQRVREIIVDDLLYTIHIYHRNNLFRREFAGDNAFRRKAVLILDCLGNKACNIASLGTHFQIASANACDIQHIAHQAIL